MTGREGEVFAGPNLEFLDDHGVEALPGRPYIHTHFGFGYRLSHPFHKAATGR